MNRMRNLSRSLVVASSIGLLGLMQGCTTDNCGNPDIGLDSRSWNILGGLAGVAANNANTQQGYNQAAIAQVGANAMAQNAAVNEQQQRALQVAQAGAPQLNVNYVLPQNGQQVQPQNSNYVLERIEGIKDYKGDSLFGELIIAVCNYVKDFNGNGIMDAPEEYVGLGERRSRREKINIRIGTKNRLPPNTIHYTLYGPDGKTIWDYSPIDWGYGIEDIHEPNTLNVGNYIIIVSHEQDKAPVGRLDFKVTE